VVLDVDRNHLNIKHVTSKNHTGEFEIGFSPKNLKDFTLTYISRCISTVVVSCTVLQFGLVQTIQSIPANNIVLIKYCIIEYYIIHLSKVLCTAELIFTALILASRRSNPLK